MICPSCRTENPEGSKFCGECGNSLSGTSKPAPQDLTFDEKLAKIQKYLPGNITEKILSQRDRIEGERKQVSVLFTDMAGYTTLSEKLDPEEVYSLMDQVYEILIHKVTEYGGTVNEFTGDGIMALFGAPIALEDAPQRAIRASLAIHREIVQFNDKVSREKPGHAPLRMRAGIHTGPVVVGTVGNDLRVTFTAMGDTVNLASRMESLAGPGTTYVTEATFLHTEGFFQFEALGEKRVKGRGASINVYRVIAPGRHRTRFDVIAERGLTPLVGREKELQLLLKSFNRVQGGKGQAWSIIGEAGIGKSRMLYELREALAELNLTFLEGKCLSYGRGMAYYPFVDILKSIFDIWEDDPDFQIREKVTKGLEKLQVDKTDVLPYLLELLWARDCCLEGISMSPEARRDRTVEALNQVILKTSDCQPVVLIIEDLHWIDKSSEVSLNYVLEIIAKAKILLILTYRTGFFPSLVKWPHHNRIMLNRLSNQESLRLVSQLLDTRTIDPDLAKLILEKTEGVPFFIEEMLKSLRDLNIIEKKNGGFRLAKDNKTVAIPSTIQDMIMARVDSLPGAAKTVLQIGSVIEREFTYDLIKRVVDLPEQQLLDHLSTLKKAGLLYVRDGSPNPVYVFRHALTRDVVYDSILRKTKKQIHERIGFTLEERHQDKIDEYYGSIVNHFIASENYRKGADYSRLACLKADNSLLLHEAVDYAQKWILALEGLPQTAALLEEVVEARTARGFYFFRMSNMAKAKESIDPIVETVLKKNLKDRQGTIGVIIGSYKYMVEEDLSESIEWLGKAIKLTEETGDLVTSIYAQYMLGLVLAFNCNFKRAQYYFEMLLHLSIAMEFPWRVSAMKSNLSVYCYDYQGLVTQGYLTSEEAVRIAKESGDIYSKAMAYSSHGTSCYYRGRITDAESYLSSGIAFAEKINLAAHIAMAHQYLGHVCLNLKRYQEAQEHYSRAIQVREETRLFPSSANLNRISLNRAKLLSGEKDISLERLYLYARENRVRIYEGCLARYIGDILSHLGIGHFATAVYWIERAIEADTRNGMKCDLGWDYALYGDFYKRNGESSRAKEYLGKAIDVFKSCGADGWVEETEGALAQV
jgi:class 3 adenylate cyclase/tetratricopeptide (TPR) repeat protein